MPISLPQRGGNAWSRCRVLLEDAVVTMSQLNQKSQYGLSPKHLCSMRAADRDALAMRSGLSRQQNGRNILRPMRRPQIALLVVIASVGLMMLTVGGASGEDSTSGASTAGSEAAATPVRELPGLPVDARMAGQHRP